MRQAPVPANCPALPADHEGAHDAPSRNGLIIFPSR
jgi:hypothetical protein